LIFKDENDYYRGIFSIYEFNNEKPTTIRERREARVKIKQLLKEQNRGPTSVPDKRNKFVEILSFAFMPNHIHLLVKQIKDKGITEFMRKVGTGYGGYSNRKYNRKGHVFQNRFFSVHIENEEQLKIVFVYLHANPASLIEPNWREKGIKEPEKVIKFLENYKWSSYFDYIGGKNFPSVTDREFIFKIMGGESGCKESVDYWIRCKGEIKKFPELSLEN
jgi:putative transposase